MLVFILNNDFKNTFDLVAHLAIQIGFLYGLFKLVCWMYFSKLEASTLKESELISLIHSQKITSQ